MLLGEIKSTIKRKKRVRVGRGIAAGKGKTAGRGTKGQKSRSGGKIPAKFEGGQLALVQRLPKLRGFKNRFKKDVRGINLGKISEIFATKSKITKSDFLDAAIIKSPKQYVKILSVGNVKKPLKIEADFFSKGALEKIKKAGGEAVALQAQTRPSEARARFSRKRGS